MAAEPRPPASDADVALAFINAGQAYLKHVDALGVKLLNDDKDRVERWRAGIDKGGYGVFPITVSNDGLGLAFKLTRDVNLAVFFLGARVHRNMVRKWPVDRMLRLMVDNDALARQALPEILTAESALRAAIRKSKSVFKTTCDRLDVDVETVRVTLERTVAARRKRAAARPVENG